MFNTRLKSIKYFLFITLLLCNLIFAATYNFAGGTDAGNWNFLPGDIININGTTTFTGNVTANGAIGNGVIINIAQNVQMIMDSTSSLYLNGYSYNNGYILIQRSGATGVHLSLRFINGSRIKMNNVTIRQANRGLTIETSTALINQVVVENPLLNGMRIINCSPRITGCWFQTAGCDNSLYISYTATPTRGPELFGNHFVPGTYGHIEFFAPNNPLNLYFEGNYWNGVAPVVQNYAGASVIIDNYPVLSISPYASAIQLSGGAGATGTINNPNFYMFDNDIWRIANGDITIANGAAVYMGVSRNILGAIPQYSGNSSLQFTGLYNLIVSGGGTLRSTGTVAKPNTIRSTGGGAARGVWSSIQVPVNANINMSNTTISNGTSGLLISGIPTTFSLSNVSFNYNVNGVNSSISSTISNLSFTGNTYAMTFTGGTPIAQNNTIASGGTAPNYGFNFSGGVNVPAGNIINNNMSGMTYYATSTGAAAPRVYLQHNYFGVNPPVDANFQGTDQIRYEWWHNAAGGADVYLRPTASCTLPANGANLPAIPTSLTFNIAEVGYHNGTPINYEIQLSTDPAFGSLVAGYPRTGTTAANGTFANTIPGGSVVIGTRYYWRVRARSLGDEDIPAPTQWGAWSPSFNFIVAQPRLGLTLTANKSFASAGETIQYTIDFNNTSNVTLSQARIVSILPDDVYFYGNITLRSIDWPVGQYNVYVYRDINGLITLARAINRNVPNPLINQTYSFSNGAGWDAGYDLNVTENVQVRRIDVEFNSINNSPLPNTGSHGFIDYTTIVK